MTWTGTATAHLPVPPDAVWQVLSDLSLRRRLGRPAAPPTPAPLLRAGAVGLRSDPALALTGRHCTSTVLAEAGFTFAHPDIDSALAEIYG